MKIYKHVHIHMHIQCAAWNTVSRMQYLLYSMHTMVRNVNLLKLFGVQYAMHAVIHAVCCMVCAIQCFIYGVRNTAHSKCCRICNLKYTICGVCNMMYIAGYIMYYVGNIAYTI